jgi:hypothetical protein
MSLTGTKKVTAGEFTMDMASVEVSGGKSGVFGHIKFKPFATSPRTESLKLLQIAKDVVQPAGTDYTWTGGEARRMNAMTTANPGAGVEGGYFVDVMHANRTPRANASDAAVSPYYNEDYKSQPDAAGNFQDGWQKGGTDQKEAILRDFPGSSGNRTFKFETAAKAEDTGTIYGTVKWQFTIENSKIKNDDWTVQNSESATFNAAVNQFNETYKNPGASTAPSPPSASPDAGVPDAGPPIQDAGESLPGGIRETP